MNINTMIIQMQEIKLSNHVFQNPITKNLKLGTLTGLSPNNWDNRKSTGYLLITIHTFIMEMELLLVYSNDKQLQHSKTFL